MCAYACVDMCHELTRLCVLRLAPTVYVEGREISLASRWYTINILELSGLGECTHINLHAYIHTLYEGSLPGSDGYKQGIAGTIYIFAIVKL